MCVAAEGTVLILQVLSQREQNEMTDLSAIFAEVGAY